MGEAGREGCVGEGKEEGKGAGWASGVKGPREPGENAPLPRVSVAPGFCSLLHVSKPLVRLSMVCGVFSKSPAHTTPCTHGCSGS